MFYWRIYASLGLNVLSMVIRISPTRSCHYFLIGTLVVPIPVDQDGLAIEPPADGSSAETPSIHLIVPGGAPPSGDSASPETHIPVDATLNGMFYWHIYAPFDLNMLGMVIRISPTCSYHYFLKGPLVAPNPVYQDGLAREPPADGPPAETSSIHLIGLGGAPPSGISASPGTHIPADAPLDGMFYWHTYTPFDLNVLSMVIRISPTYSYLYLLTGPLVVSILGDLPGEIHPPDAGGSSHFYLDPESGSPPSPDPATGPTGVPDRSRPTVS